MGTVKRPTSLAQQIDILKSRGMSVDESLARQWLFGVSYYRLSGYWYSYRILPASADPKQPKRLDEFIAGTTFEEVVALYEFDRKLRTLIHDGMERIEVAMRTRVGELLAARGALSYQNPSLFREDFDHAAWLGVAQKRVERAQKETLPLRTTWTTMTTIRFGYLLMSLISRIFRSFMKVSHYKINVLFPKAAASTLMWNA